MSRSALRSATALGKAVTSFWVHTIIEPVRSGGPLPRHWPRPVRRVMAVAFVIYVALLASVLVSGLSNSGPDGTPAQLIGAVSTSAILYLVLDQAPQTLLIFAGAVNGLILPIGFALVLWVAWRRRDL
ncbi:MAG: hypothetical protein Q4G46_01840, partial [Propionibacteriaceae bacterium]|nr:hypothetical protein [Propionibacteriaceae bacterium]